jgi:hypothetical protein
MGQTDPVARVDVIVEDLVLDGVDPDQRAVDDAIIASVHQALRKSGLNVQVLEIGSDYYRMPNESNIDVQLEARNGEAIRRGTRLRGKQGY